MNPTPDDKSSAPQDHQDRGAAGKRAQESSGFDSLGLGLPSAIDSRWGETPSDHFGYASEKERLAKRGMEDWELVTQIPSSQRRIPYWFIAVVVIVLLVALGLGFPFWGQRPGVHVKWFNWGYVAAIFYVSGAAYFVYFMTNLYGSDRAGRLDDDPQAREEKPDVEGNEKRNQDH